ncbi:MAG: hypothetical protein QM504_08245 [Pseudomonadota bacterium]
MEWYLKDRDSMTVHHNKLLVVDDNEEHGNLITKALWEAHIPVHFFKFSEEKLISLADNEIKHKGIRAILMDINLLGDGAANKNDYSAALKTIKTLVDEDNGPWVLITWSTYNDRTDELFEFLVERLPDKLKPVTKQALPKENYINGGRAAIPLHKHVSSLLSNLPAFDMLRQWETSVGGCMSEVVSTVSQAAVVSDISDYNGKLAFLLETLAKGEAGDKAEVVQFTPALHTILSDMLKDRLDVSGDFSKWLNSKGSKIKDGKIHKLWIRRINTMLNLSWKDKFSICYPGSIFKYPGNRVDIHMPLYTPTVKNKLILDQFFNEDKVNDSNAEKTTAKRKIEKENFLKSTELLMMDITPPCDHSNKKAVLRKFVTVLKVPVEYSNKKNKLGKYLADGPYLKLSPEFIDAYFDILSEESDINEGFFFIVNARLIFSIKEDEIVGVKRYYKGRIKEKFLNDLSGWIGRHMSRAGYSSI